MIREDNNQSVFECIKQKSESQWSAKELNTEIYGFQIQEGTKWRKGLKEVEIQEYEKELGVVFPEIYKQYLQTMNGTDTKTINLYGVSGHPYQYGSGYYSFPDDIAIIKEKIQWIYDSFNINSKIVDQQNIPHIFPLVSHRFLVLDRCESNPILSMHSDDVIIYSDDIITFLKDDLFFFGRQSMNLQNIKVSFWTE